MANLPYIETAYRDFLVEKGPLHETMLEERRRYDEGREALWLPREEWPDEIPEQVAVPGTIAYNLYAQLRRQGRAALGPAKERGDERMVKATRHWVGMDRTPLQKEYSEHVFFSAYSNTRHTYRPTEKLWSEMSKMDWPGDTPAGALEYLPLPAFAIASPGGTVYTICYDLLTQKETSGKLELRIGELTKEGRIEPLVPLHLEGELDDSIESALVQAKRELRGRSIDADLVEGEDLKSFLDGLVNFLLYLAGEDDTQERDKSYPDRPAKRHKQAAEDTAFEDKIEKDPIEADVGVRFQQAFERYEEEVENEEEGEGGKKRPHIRRPHPHLYWTGPGRSIPKVKYLGPIAVNIEDTDKGEVPPTEQEVRSGEDSHE